MEEQEILYTENQVRAFSNDPTAKIENLVVIGSKGLGSIEVFEVFHKRDNENLFHRKEFYNFRDAYNWIDKNVMKLKLPHIRKT